jgi:hypothetical protein
MFLIILASKGKDYERISEGKNKRLAFVCKALRSGTKSLL